MGGLNSIIKGIAWVMGGCSIPIEDAPHEKDNSPPKTLNFNFLIDRIKKFIADKIMGWITYLGEKPLALHTCTVDNDDSSGTFYAIKEELKKQYLPTAHHVFVKDGFGMQSFHLPNKVYEIIHNSKKMLIKLINNKIIVGCEENYARIYCVFAYQKHTSKETKLTSYRNTDTWGSPNRRAKVIISNLTDDMQSFMDDVDIFMKNRNRRARGYLLNGVKGAGKSIMMKVIASKYDMPMYHVTLNSPTMSGVVLINLISKVPPGSLIIFDEFEKQYQSAITNRREGYLSSADILEALSDCISERTIVVLIANKIDALPLEFMDPLLRSGRIDKQFEFNERYQEFEEVEEI